MPIPPPQYDTVLIREHLYQDLKHKWLVIPPQANEPGFRPVHEVGLGLSEYRLIDTNKLSLYPEASDTSTRRYINQVTFVTLVSLFVFFTAKLLVKRIQSRSSTNKLPLNSRTPIPEKLDLSRESSPSPYTYSNDLEEGNMQGLGLTTPHSHSAHSSMSSYPPSLVNTPSSPSLLSSPSVSETSLRNFGLENSIFSNKMSVFPTKVSQDPNLMNLMGSNLKLQ